MSALSPGDTTEPQDALERLAEALGFSDFVTAMVSTHGKMPCLSVASRHVCEPAGDIYARHGWYW